MKAVHQDASPSWCAGNMKISVDCIWREQTEVGLPKHVIQWISTGATQLKPLCKVHTAQLYKTLEAIGTMMETTGAMIKSSQIAPTAGKFLREIPRPPCQQCAPSTCSL